MAEPQGAATAVVESPMAPSGEDSLYQVEPEEPAPPAPEPDAEPSAPAPDTTAELAQLRESFAAVQQELAARRSQDDQARMAEMQRLFQQDTSALESIWATVAPGLDDKDQATLRESLQYVPAGKLLASPAVQQQLTAWKAQAEEHTRSESVWKLVEDHFGHTTTLSRARELYKELMSIPDASAREKFAKLLASSVREQNRRSRVDGGLERVEGGQRVPGGVLNTLEDYERELFRRGSLNDQQWEKYMALRRSRGMS